MAGQAQLTALCIQNGFLPYCWTQADGTQQEVIAIPFVGANGASLPTGSTTVAGNNNGLFYVDLQGNPVTIANPLTELTYGACALPPVASHVVCIVDPTDSTVDPIPARLETTGTGATAVDAYFSLIDGSAITLSATAQPGECSRFDYEELEQCVLTTTGAIDRQVTRVRVYDKTDTSDTAAAVSPVTEVYLRADGTVDVLAAGETYGSCSPELPRFVEGCVTFADGTKQSVRQIIPVIAGQLDFTAVYYLDLMLGTPVTVDPAVDVFTVGACPTAPPKCVDGCLWDDATSTGRAVIREYPYVAFTNSYDYAAPAYYLAADGSVVVPAATETFTLGNCGVACPTC